MLNREVIKIVSLIILLFLFACSNPERSLPNSGSSAQAKVFIQPLGRISQADVTYVYSELKKRYSNIFLNASITLPQNAYYPPRQRYRADSLIHYLGSITPDGNVTIGLTDKDISTTKNEHVDWGVMGLGFCPGNSCVASTFRLSKSERRMQFFKVAIHELGHTQGLQHCKVRSCFMRDAEGGNPTNEEVAFCNRCSHLLENRGWHFN
jgi:archaemetzincin